MKKQNVRTLSLIVCCFTYLLVGAAVFDALESENEVLENEFLTTVVNDFVVKYNVTTEDQLQWELLVESMIPHKAGVQWKFAGAFYFATTVITTIGYGHSCPASVEGKVFCMAYALMGIPLTLVMFQAIGERLNTFTAYILKNCKRCLKMKSTEVTETNLIMVISTVNSIVMTSGAAYFDYYEDWGYINSFYYCFITLTTIGFGDFVALQQENALKETPEYVAFVLVFILFGLTVESAALNLLVLRFITMNTEDEKREEAEAQAAAQVGVRLEGDVITANGSVISGGELDLTDEYNDTVSVCSCSCYGRSNKKHRYKVTRSPGRISHLLPLHTLDSSGRDDLYTNYVTDIIDEKNSNISPAPETPNRKRASI
ncbi:PREDICTED: two pore potassium channel protein sup-9-like [Priapulus caudatus]|uniref:Two pore potassium channel protein sup-9-like n=1 Tax=Priapulus caudatus TaxID=37621 RepID=A0ABM1EAS1_PRICU|nr:PREDICTED: two pore potassium channel protein sup-9-like [Priapulus caudatus]